MLQNLKRFIGRQFETVRPIFDFLLRFGLFVCLFVFCFEYFTSDPNFNAKFFLKSIFLMSGPYGPPPLTTDGRTEDFYHFSVKTQNMYTTSLSNY